MTIRANKLKICRPAALAGAIAVAVAMSTVVAPREASAQSGGAPGIVTDGSNNTSVGGAAAATAGDRTDQGSAVVGGSSNVFINGKPAARVGDKTNCGGIAISGSSNVFVNGKPLVRSGDMTTGCK